MTDTRIERLAALLVDYSLELREGKVLRIDSLDAGSPLVLALYGAALRAGGLPYTNVSLSGLGETLFNDPPNSRLDALLQVHVERRR